MKKLFCLLCFSLLVLMVGCNNHNPILSSSESGAGSSLDAASETAKSIPEYIDADALANRSYELRHLFAQKDFDSPEELTANVLVQYAFCHMYYENLIDMPTSGNKLREATPDEITYEILKNFGSVDVDITTADLYNRGKQKFEMWEPNYGTEIYYDVGVTAAGKNVYKAATTFYTDSHKNEVQSKTVLTVEDVGGQILIRKLSSSNLG